MRPLFTIHAGEYLVALEVERRFPRALLWVPARDTGVDLLVSDRRRRRTVALQVKYSKDFLPHMGAEFHKHLRARGWWTLDRDKLRGLVADLWVFVLPRFDAPTVDCLVIPPSELWRHLRAVHGRAEEAPHLPHGDRDEVLLRDARRRTRRPAPDRSGRVRPPPARPQSVAERLGTVARLNR